MRFRRSMRTIGSLSQCHVGKFLQMIVGHQNLVRLQHICLGILRSVTLALRPTALRHKFSCGGAHQKPLAALNFSVLVSG